MAAILSKISLVCFILAGGFLALTVFFWFKFNILKVIDDLTLRTARKQIARIREQNEKDGAKSSRSKEIHAIRSRQINSKLDLDDEEKYSIGKRTAVPRVDDERMETGVLEENQPDTLPLLDETMLLDGASVRVADDDETVRLGEEQVYDEQNRPTSGVKLTMLEEVMLIHTDERIC